jgi:hypothetical protein
MRAIHARSQSAHRERIRHFVAALIGVVVFNALLALIHTLGANSPSWEAVVQFIGRHGFLAVGAMFLGAYAIGYKGNALFGMCVLALGALTQAHLFFVAPQFLGWPGVWYYAIDAIAVIVVAYDIHLRVQGWRSQRHAPVADVVALRPGASRPHSHRAA